jgi:ribose transport system substrate-binding protein
MLMKTLVVAAGLAAGLFCSTLAIAETKPTIAVIVNEANSPYWQAVLAGARAAGTELGANISELGDPSGSDAKSQSLLDKAVASNPAAVIIVPAQFTGIGKSIDEAAKKVKVIGIDSPADTKALTSLLTTDNVNAGRLAAEALAKAITTTYGDTEGNVVIITAKPGVAALDQRAQGFKEVVGSKFKALDIVSDKTADGNPETVMNMMKDYIANVSDLRGVFVTDPIMTQVVGQAVAEKKSDDKINIIGVGSDEKLVKYLQDNTISALIVEDPYRLGYMSVKTALSASRGEQVAALGSVEVALVTKDNMSSSHSQELLHPKVK